MDYERIEKKSIISPTKLRMKLMGPHNNKKKEGSKSNSNSSRTSPSRLQVPDDTEFSKNSLLASKSDSDNDDNVVASTTNIEVAKLPNEPVLDLTESDDLGTKHRSEGVPRENDQQRPQQFRKGDLSMAPLQASSFIELVVSVRIRIMVRELILPDKCHPNGMMLRSG